MTSNRKRYMAEQKLRILRRFLLDGVPAATICEESGISSSTFRRWRREFFERGAEAVHAGGSQSLKRQVAALRKELERKNALIHAVGRSRRLLDCAKWL